MCLKTPKTDKAVTDAVFNINKEYPNISIAFLYEQFKNVVNIAIIGLFHAIPAAKNPRYPKLLPVVVRNLPSTPQIRIAPPSPASAPAHKKALFCIFFTFNPFSAAAL